MAWTFGINRLLSGEKAADGGMGTALSEHDETLKGTATLETTDETIQWIETEEKGKRLPISKNDTETTLKFEVANPSLETQAYYLGGTVKTVNSKKTYSPPVNKPTIERSFLVETKEGYNIQIPNGKVVAKPLGGQIGTDGVMTMQVTVTVQLPTKAGVDAITFMEK
ncbi:hypothetical protein D1Y73_02600 [Riemerella anatipestifer]|uniref:hypothetical protein n=1 Tax=Riemerella anatipestifer TaxID=34085 RepID=UPI0012B30C99|nr:hypothetical protein [Riemerella anatipestifer]MSN81947.1 hypothetical protein [Riemerella anatipestifer]UXN80994.1 hypothetical protein [Phage vB_RanS_PJN03]